MSEWSHLPNAALIDRVIASLAANRDAWHPAHSVVTLEARKATPYQIWKPAWTTARSILTDKGLFWAFDAARERARAARRWDSSTGVASDAILALVAYEDCGYLLDERLEHVLLLASLGVESAVLMLPACAAFAKG